MIERRFEGPAPAVTLPRGAIDTQTHMFLPGFPAAPGAMPLPEAAPGPDAYRRVMQWLGIDRVVITQGNAHLLDNANLVACLEAMGRDIARGVAAVAPGTPESELAALHAAGVRGARIMDLPGGAVGLDRLEAVDAMVRELDWVLAVQFDGTHIADHADRLSWLGGRYIIDHHGKFFAGVTPESPQVTVLKRLMERGNCWFKLAGCYESSRSGGPDYADIGAVARDIIAFAPERVIWGTNWPHNLAKTTEDYPDDGALLDTVLGWFDDPETRRKALVDTPEALFDF